MAKYVTPFCIPNKNDSESKLAFSSWALSSQANLRGSRAEISTFESHKGRNLLLSEPV